MCYFWSCICAYEHVFSYLQWCRALLSGPHADDLHSFQSVAPARRGSEVVARAAIWRYQRWRTALCCTACRKRVGIRLRNACFCVWICAEFGSELGRVFGCILGTYFGTALGTRIGRRHVETQLFVSSWCRRFLVPKVVRKSEPKTAPFFEQILGQNRGTET